MPAEDGRDPPTAEGKVHGGKSTETSTLVGT